MFDHSQSQHIHIHNHILPFVQSFLHACHKYHHHGQLQAAGLLQRPAVIASKHHAMQHQRHHTTLYLLCILYIGLVASLLAADQQLLSIGSLPGGNDHSRCCGVDTADAGNLCSACGARYCSRYCWHACTLFCCRWQAAGQPVGCVSKCAYVAEGWMVSSAWSTNAIAGGCMPAQGGC